MQMFPFGMVTVITHPKLLEELKRAPEDVLSFEGFSDLASAISLLIMWEVLSVNTERTGRIYDGLEGIQDEETCTGRSEFVHAQLGGHIPGYGG
jgi:hypothetical protein